MPDTPTPFVMSEDHAPVADRVRAYHILNAVKLTFEQFERVAATGDEDEQMRILAEEGFERPDIAMHAVRVRLNTYWGYMDFYRQAKDRAAMKRMEADYKHVATDPIDPVFEFGLTPDQVGLASDCRFAPR